MCAGAGTLVRAVALEKRDVVMSITRIKKDFICASSFIMWHKEAP